MAVVRLDLVALVDVHVAFVILFIAASVGNWMIVPSAFQHYKGRPFVTEKRRVRVPFLYSELRHRQESQRLTIRYESSPLSREHQS